VRFTGGEVVGLLGPNGAGKTTTFYMIVGLITATEGNVCLDGADLTDLRMHQRARHGIGYLPQEPSVFRKLTVEENILAIVEAIGVPRRERPARVLAHLSELNLQHLGKQKAYTLSGGERRRFEIARALVTRPKFLLMDEPFAALDAQTRTLLHEQLQDLWLATRKTILFVTHSVGEAVRLADRVIVLHAHPGRIRREIKIQLGPPREFDSRDITELVRMVRREIEEEVNRVNAEMNDEYRRSQDAGDLDRHAVDLGGGI
jgi:lipopolysaccharide export system ATP-binding protein